MLKHNKPNRCTSPILKGLYHTFQAGLGILDLWLHHISNNTAIIITRYIWIRSCKLSISQSLRDLCVSHGPLNTWSLCARDQPVLIHDCMALYLCVSTQHWMLCPNGKTLLGQMISLSSTLAAQESAICLFQPTLGWQHQEAASHWLLPNPHECLAHQVCEAQLGRNSVSTHGSIAVEPSNQLASVQDIPGCSQCKISLKLRLAIKACRPNGLEKSLWFCSPPYQMLSLRLRAPRGGDLIDNTN